MKNFRTYDLAVEFYSLAQALKVSPILREQLLRAASSIALNLSEGWGRRTLTDKQRYFSIALGSLRECQAILQLEKLTATTAYQKLDVTGAALYSLIKNAR